MDITYGLSSVFIWSSVEPSVGVISACLPPMREFPSLPTHHHNPIPLFLRRSSPGTPNPVVSSNSPYKSGPLFGKRFFFTSNSRSKSDKTPSAKKTTSSSQPASVSLASPLKDGFTRLDGPTYRDQLETQYRETSETTSDSRKGSTVAHGSYDDKAGRQWLMYGPKSINKEGDGDGWKEEGRAIQMREWPKRRGSVNWTEEV